MKCALIVGLLCLSAPAHAERCIPFSRVFDAEYMPGGYNVTLTKRSKQSVWVRFPSQDTAGVVLCGSGTRWRAVPSPCPEFERLSGALDQYDIGATIEGTDKPLWRNVILHENRLRKVLGCVRPILRERKFGE